MGKIRFVNTLLFVLSTTTRVRGTTCSVFARHGKIMGLRLGRVTMVVVWPLLGLELKLGFDARARLRRLDPKPRHS